MSSFRSLVRRSVSLSGGGGGAAAAYCGPNHHIGDSVLIETEGPAGSETQRVCDAHACNQDCCSINTRGVGGGGGGTAGVRFCQRIGRSINPSGACPGISKSQMDQIKQQKSEEMFAKRAGQQRFGPKSHFF